MRVLHDTSRVDPDLRRGVVTIGNFDGIHQGHARLLRRCVERAGGGAVVAMTFDPAPVAVLSPDRAPRRLTPLSEKLRLLETRGATAAMVLRTDAALLSLTPEQFVEGVLAAPLAPRCVVEGPTFRFGVGRSGSVDTLRELGPRFGFDVDVVPPAEIELPPPDVRQIVSSSLVRRLIAEGRVEAAAGCLDRPYVLIGPVIHGAARGRGLGFPTINIDIGDMQWPADGVYAGRARFECATQAGPFPAAISVGSRATFGTGVRVIEAYLLDHEGERYGQTARLELVSWVRAQRAFASPEELTQQIARDVEAVRRVAALCSEPRP
ncbi:MAG: riboflavin biosynthesis protein RibF [Phycisphaerae bacterium]|nr:riboflavin biosynthesis protein RibF [Phycisphaerae bacterium]NUQ46377.1 riboflavin biosynthesis protein RibF [Phycisphaerae bacterium]